MGLITNISQYSNIPVTWFGGTVMSPEFSNFNRQENWILNYVGMGITSKTGAMPTGNNHPIAWRLPLKAGAISSHGRLIGSGIISGGINYGLPLNASVSGSGNISASINYGLPLIADLVGSGTISNALASLGIGIFADISGSGGISDALGGLLVEMMASLSGSGEISDAEILAYLNAIADLTGSGNITSADLEGLGELIAVLQGVGVITSTLVGTGELSADIKSYGEMTSQGIRDAVWQAAALSFNDPGSMGELLNLAGTGGVNYNLLAEAVWQYASRALTEKTGIEKNQDLDNFTFLMTDMTSHSPITGLTVHAYRSIDGGSFAFCLNAVSEISNGIYKINLDASDLNGDVITFRFSASGADDRMITIITEP